MSQTDDNLVPEISKTYAQFRTLLAGYWKSGIRPVIVNLGTFSDGTRYSVVDQYRDTKFYLVTNLTRNIPFSSISPGVGIGGGTYDAGPAGFFNVAGPGGGYNIAGVNYISGSAANINFGNASKFTTIAGTFISNQDRPWRDFLLDNETNVVTALAGAMRRNDSKFIFQGSISDAANTQRFKSFGQLWETGSFAGDGLNSSFAVNFVNGQKDTAYFVTIETDDGNTATASGSHDITSKTASGFTVEFTAILSALVTVRWFAVRYGV